jgi:hypothetical protein
VMSVCCGAGLVVVISSRQSALAMISLVYLRAWRVEAPSIYMNTVCGLRKRQDLRDKALVAEKLCSFTSHFVVSMLAPCCIQRLHVHQSAKKKEQCKEQRGRSPRVLDAPKNCSSDMPASDLLAPVSRLMRVSVREMKSFSP